MRHIDPKEVSIAESHGYLLGGVGPRPIALVSTLSPDGIPNLSPFSFFNAFGANPPTIAFSASSRVRDGSRKDTYHNLVATKECVVQAVTYDMVQQISLASTEYDSDVDEFVKSGLTPVPSDIVKPARVQESPFQMECRLTQMVPLGDGKGAGNLAICEVVRFHISDEVFVDGVIHPDKIDLVGRNSASFYTRANGQAIFEVAKPVGKQGIGFDQLPASVLESASLTANHKAQLANCETLPNEPEIELFLAEHGGGEASAYTFKKLADRNDYTGMLRTALALSGEGYAEAVELFHQTAAVALDAGDTDFAWKTLFLSDQLTKSEV